MTRASGHPCRLEAAFLIGAAVVLSPANAQAGEFQINTYTTGNQAGIPGAAMTPTGDFVVVWEGQSASFLGIQGRLFSAGGLPLGPEFQVNTSFAYQPVAPSVAMDPSGRFAVAWQSRISEGSIQGRRFAADGMPVGDEFEISPTGLGKGVPSVGMDATGAFAVAWAGFEAQVIVFTDVFARRYAADGMTMGPEFQVNGYTTGYQDGPKVAMGESGDFVVVWQSAPSPIDVFSTSVQAQLYDTMGTPQGPQFQVNTYTVGPQSIPRVGKGLGGNFVVVWNSIQPGPDPSGFGIWGRRYAVDGTPLSGEFVVNTYTTGHQTIPSVAMLATGDFLAAWESDWTGSGDAEVRARRFRQDGTAFGADFQINSYTTGRQGGTSVAGDAAGNFVVTWVSAGSLGTDTSGTSVQGALEVSDLQIANSDGVATAVPGGALTYTITATHATGLQALVGGTVIDLFSPALNCTWTCAGSAGGACSPGPVAGPITDPVTLPVGSSVTYTANCAIAPTATGTITTTATVTGSSAGLFDPEPSNNSATDLTGLQGLVIDDVSQLEGNGSTTPFGFTVTLASPLATPVTVDYGTSDGTASVSDNDYLATSGTLSFSPGETSKPVIVDVIGDMVFEADETFFVTLSNASGSIIVDGIGVGTILNDDSAMPSGSLDELVHGSMETRSLETLPGPVAIAQEWRLSQRSHASYEVVVDATTGDLGPDGPALDRLASDGTVVQSAVGAGTGSARSLRWENAGPVVDDQRIRVQSRGCILDCDASDTFRIRLLETTLHGARFNNSATQVTIVLIQDASEAGVSGHLDFWGGSGVLLHSEPFTLQPRQTFVFNSSTAGALLGQAGTLTLSHDGRHGALVGKAVAVEPATGFTFDTPLEPRRR